VTSEPSVSDVLLGYAGARRPQAGPAHGYGELMRLGVAAGRANQHELALGYFQAAAEAQPDLPDPLHAQGLVHTNRGDGPAAARAYHDAVLRDPAHAPAIEALAATLEGHPTADYGWMRGEVVAACLARDGIAHLDLADVGQRLLRDGALAPFLAQGAAGDWPAAARAMLRERARIQDPLLLGVLGRGLVVILEIERLMAAARRAILLAHARGDGPEAPLRPFVAALAHQGWHNEYVVFADPDETAAVDALAADTARQLTGATRIGGELEAKLLVLAMYRPLAAVPGSDALLGAMRKPLGAALQGLVDRTLRVDREVAAEVAGVTAWGTIVDDVSRRVQAQYEESPYPRWTSLNLAAPGEGMRRLRKVLGAEVVGRWPAELAVLVAGCGTGRHALAAGARYGAGAKVLAVDLSRTSLAYASRMARRVPVQNVRFLQADILDLPADTRFHVIEAAGVLHHMRDPLEGWRALADRLHPGGAMQVGLYSERARRHVVEAIAEARRRGVPATPEAIRAFRHDAIAAPPGPWVAALARYRDFYALSQVRDLIFHVQEHRFTPLGVRDALAALGLSFRGFVVPEEVRRAFLAAHPGALLDLAAWDAFEQDNPDTFTRMMHLWCVKAAG